MTQNEIEALGGATPLLAVMAAWRVFKDTHDVADAKVCCCEHTLKLFESLDELEKEMRRW